MIYKIIINIILVLNIFIYKMDNLDLYKISHEMLVILLCASLSFYMYYVLKIKDKKLLLVNIIYMMGVSYLYPPAIVIVGSMWIEYIVSNKCGNGYILTLVVILLTTISKLQLDYNQVFLGTIACIFIYSILKYEEQIEKLEQYNYDLKDRNYALEERSKLENRTSYKNIESIKIEERNIISQKLHDKIGHTLAGSIMQLEALKIIINSDKDKGLIMIDSITNNLRDGMDDIRQTLRMIKPNQSDINIKTLKKLLDEFSSKSNIKTSLKIEGDLNEINLVYWKAIIESIREILTNTIKYCNGDRINVEISVLNKIIRVHTKDNGLYKGIIKKGMGLIGIEERIINLNGNVYFSNEDGFSNLIIFKR